LSAAQSAPPAGPSTAGGAPHAADKQKQRAEEVTKHILIDASSQKRRLGVEELNHVI